MKYRRLNEEELQELEQEFIHFLAANGIPANDWEKMKRDKPEETEETIELFSDMVMDRVLKNITYVEHRGERDIIVFKCNQDDIEMIGINVSDSLDVDLNNQASVASMLLNTEQLDKNVKAFKQSKKYIKQREEEIFEMLQSGCFITNDTIFQTLSQFYK